MDRGSTNSIGLRPPGAPLPRPLPVRSSRRGETMPTDRDSTASIELAPAGRPLTRLGSHLPQKPLGEVDFDPDSTRCVVTAGAEIQARRPTSNWRPRAPPYSPQARTSPQNPWGRWTSIPLRQVRRTSLPRAVCGGGPGRGAAHHPALHRPKRQVPTHRPTSPGSFGGGGPVVPARRGPARARPKHAAALFDVYTLPRPARKRVRVSQSPPARPTPPPPRSRRGQSAATAGAAPAR
jgi:hypothetical protein